VAADSAARLAPPDKVVPVSRRCLVLLAAAIAVLALVPASAQAARGFKLGVSAADVRANSAILWAKSSRRGPVILEVRRRGPFGACGGRGSRRARATRSNDLTVQKKVGGLRPGKSYRYRWCRRGRRRAVSAVGRFKTAPLQNANRTIRFGWTGDMDAARAPGQNRPFWNNFEVLDQMRLARNDFNILLGDTIYSDSEVAGVATKAITVGAKWAKYRLNLGMRPLQRLRGSGGVYYHWDDHEFINDFSPNDTSADLGIPISPSTLYNRSVRAFMDYEPATFSRAQGIYRTVRWGRNLELFFLDERSFRSAKADTGSTCDNPPGGDDTPDIAPTVPQSNRDNFAPFFSQLGNPVPPSCLAEINDPNRSYLGAAQLARFKQAVNASTATWKVIVNELPIQQLYANPYDRWEGYEHERDEVLNYLKDNVENVVFLSTDIHGNLVNETTTSLLEPPGYVPTGIFDISTGPIATRSFEKQIDAIGGGAGFGETVRVGVLKPQPPDGIGADCAALNEFSYGQVTVSVTALTIDLLDQSGTPVREGTFGGAGPCARIVIPAT
jgi:alkaline phosphatase D